MLTKDGVAEVRSLKRNGPIPEGKYFKGGINDTRNASPKPDLSYRFKEIDASNILDELKNVEILYEDVDEVRREVELTVKMPLSLFDRIYR